MTYMGDRDFWNEKFRTRGDGMMLPEGSLVENIGWFREGSVLDLACGDGRNTRYLLGKGYSVTAVDFSSAALERLERFTDSSTEGFTTMLIDLGMPDCLHDIGIFDNIVVNHFRLRRNHLMGIGSHLRRGGILFICGFGEKHVTDSRIREEDLIHAADFEGLQDSFELIHHKETSEDRGFIVMYLFRKI